MDLAEWKLTKAPDGRPYYYNTRTRETSWTPPTGAQTTPSQTQLWREHVAPDGRKYWSNTVTKQTTWIMPPEFQAAQAAAPAVNGASMPSRPTQADYSHRPQSAHTSGQDRFSDTVSGARGERAYNYSAGDNFSRNFVAAAPVDAMDMTNLEDAKEAFQQLLRSKNVKAEHSWKEAQRMVIGEAAYRSIKEPKERKATFEEYRVQIQQEAYEQEREAKKKFRETFTERLQDFAEIGPRSRWKFLKRTIETRTKLSGVHDSEKASVFEDYVTGLEVADLEQRRSDASKAKKEFRGLLGALEIPSTTRWADARKILAKNERWMSDKLLQEMPGALQLQVYREHVRMRQDIEYDRERAAKIEARHQKRRNREAFRDLLNDLSEQRIIRPGAKWMDVLPYFEDDDAYTNLLGQAGSTPLELFFDQLEIEEEAAKPVRHKMLDVIDALEIDFNENTTWDEIVPKLSQHPSLQSISQDRQIQAFESIHAKARRAAARNAYQRARSRERKLRDKADELRRVMRDLQPAITLQDSWADIQPRLEKYPEYKDAETDENRQAAFDKYMQRLREAEERSKYRERARGRDEREYYSSRRRARQSHTPEPDAYEADRKKAQADRERQYRKASSGGAPESDHSYSRRSSGRFDPYERERFRRERERERMYSSRADPRDGLPRELDYGDNAGSMSDRSATRKRRESGSVHSPDYRGDKKRLRRDSATVKAEKEEEEILKSGSEEGEIEEA